MKYLTLLLILTFCQRQFEPPIMATKAKVLMISGQSNAQGNANNIDLTAEQQAQQTDIYIYSDAVSQEGYSGNESVFSWELFDIGTNQNPVYEGASTKHGLPIHIAPLIQEDGENIYILKYARGGRAISQWAKPSGAIWASGMIDYFQDGLAAIPEDYEIYGLYWDHGENGEESGYAAACITLFDNFRLEFGSDLRIFFRQLSDNQTFLDATFINNIQAAQETVAADNANNFLINSNDLTTDTIHLTAAEYGVIANRIVGNDFLKTTFNSADYNALEGVSPNAYNRIDLIEGTGGDYYVNSSVRFAPAFSAYKSNFDNMEQTQTN